MVLYLKLIFLAMAALLMIIGIVKTIQQRSFMPTTGVRCKSEPGEKQLRNRDVYYSTYTYMWEGREMQATDKLWSMSKLPVGEQVEILVNAHQPGKIALANNVKIYTTAAIVGAILTGLAITLLI